MALLSLWNPNIQFLKTDGTINAGGKLVVTDHNDAESIPANYSDADGTTLNSSPIVLDALGRATCYIDDGSTYDLYVKDANGATLWTVPEMTPGTETIVVRGGFSVSSNDRSVAVTISVDSDGVTNYDLSIQNEIDRAKEAEKGLSDAIEAEKKRAEAAESSLSKSIADETERATESILKESEARKDADDELRKMIDDSSKAEAGTASPLMDGKASVGNSLKYAREDHVHPSDTSREDITNKTTVVLGTSDSKYPTDKAVAEFVNSSIATNTANYISNNGEPFTSVEQLEAYSGPVTNNDYAFVTGIDSEGNTYYDRYKATVSGETVTWALEYRLNNSSFTAAQWSAINSGITSALVAKIHTHSNKDVLDGITSTNVANWNSKMDKQSVGNVSEPIYLENGIAKVATNVATNDKLNAKLNVDGSNATPVGVTAMMRKVPSGTGTLSDESTYFGDTDADHAKIVRRPVLDIWNWIKHKLGISASGSSTKFLNEQGEWATVASPDVSGKADKVSGATEGDVATLDANGNIVDSGVNFNQSTNTMSVNISGKASRADSASATTSGSIQENDDLNSYNAANRKYICNSKKSSTVSNKPSGASGAFELEVIRGTGDTCVQVYYSRDDVNFNYIRKRTGINNAWTDWVKLIDSSDINKSAGDLTHPCYFSGGIPVQCYGVSTYSLFSGTLNNTHWISISGTTTLGAVTGNKQFTVTKNTTVIDIRNKGGTEGNTGCMHIRVKGDGNACLTLTVQYLDVFGNSRSFEIYWSNSSHLTRVNEFVVFWAESLFPSNQSVNMHCTIVPVYLPDLYKWDGEYK